MMKGRLVWVTAIVNNLELAARNFPAEVSNTLQAGDGDLALATAPLHARGLFETLRAYR